jgi:hypothetical protein
MKLPAILLLLALAKVLASYAMAGTILADNFSTSTLNSTTPAAPTATSTAYQLFSSKSWNPTPAITANDLKFGIGSTSSGHIEVQALFSPTPIALTNVGDYLELTVTFTNTSGLFAQSGHVGFGLYHSGGVAPIAGGMNGTAVSGTTGVTGGAQGWRGYVSRVAYSGGSHRIATRPAQTSTTGNNQDLVTEGSGTQSYTGAVNLATSSSTLTQAAGTQLTEALRITLAAAGTLQIDSRLHLGADTNGTLLLSQSASASGANLLTNSFDALCVGWRDTSSAAATRMDIQSLTVTTSLVTNDPGNTVAGLYFQQQPANAVAGAIINAAGVPVTNAAVTLTLLAGIGPLNGTLSQVTDASGIASYTNLGLTAVGAKQLRAISGSFTTDSATFTITNAPAAALAFSTQPGDAAVSAIIMPPVVVQLRDAYGNDVGSNAVISLTLSSGTGILGGNTSSSTDATGKATFTNLSVSLPGTKQLTAAKTGLPSLASDTFNITNLAVVAFPGAEGAGAYATGGRGGDVYYVTTLADTGTGSFRNGISGAPAGGRTICFKVSGNIVLNSTMTINKPNITVAGQTAPGDGICFQNYSLNIAANNLIVRHLRTRLGTNALQEADAMWINSGTNILVDHLSASWSVDETLSASTDVANLTVQNCFITESLNNSIHVKGAHGYGGIISSSSDATYSYLRNLYAHHNSRNPRIGSDSQAGTMRLDFRNNVIYDYGGRAGYTGGTNESCEVNYVGNYCIKGPSGTYNYILEGGALGTHVYQSGNYIDLNENGLVDGANTGWAMFSGTYTPTNSPFSVPNATTESAVTAYQRVVALAGAMPWRRDANDQRIARTVRQQYGCLVDFVGATNQPTEYITNSGAVGVRGWPTLVAETAPTDTDSDGMPNYWELALGLNPNLASDRNNTNVVTGYTRLEEYLNWLADAHALCDRNGTVDVSLRAATGGATNLTYAVAGGSNGSVSLLGDGYTARFVAAANTNGVASFTFTATDPTTATSLGPVSYGVLITTTNAPIYNTAPVLGPITNRAIIAGNTVSFTCSVTDTDTPPQTITFALQNGPAGAMLNTNTGNFNWRPTMAQGGLTNTMSIIASDNGSPVMSATQTFSITVLRPGQPIIELFSGNGFPPNLTISGDSGPDYTVQASTNLFDWLTIYTTNSPPLPFLWTDPDAASFSQRFYRVLLGP